MAIFEKQEYSKRRFWELFMPHLVTFGFWLAISSFSFFGWQSVSPTEEGVTMGIAREILYWGFFVLGWLGIAIMLYLIVAWLFNIGIKAIRNKTRKETVDQMVNRRNKMATDLEELEKQIKEAGNDGTTKSK